MDNENKGKASKGTYSVTTVRFRTAQLESLKRAALKRASDKAGGRDAPRRADVSEIVREAADAWLSEKRRA